MEKEIQKERDGNVTEVKTYVDGKLDSIEHINERTGDTHEHEVEHGIFGSKQGKTVQEEKND